VLRRRRPPARHPQPPGGSRGPSVSHVVLADVPCGGAHGLARGVGRLDQAILGASGHGLRFRRGPRAGAPRVRAGAGAHGSRGRGVGGGRGNQGRREVSARPLRLPPVRRAGPGGAVGGRADRAGARGTAGAGGGPRPRNEHHPPARGGASGRGARRADAGHRDHPDREGGRPDGPVRPRRAGAHPEGAGTVLPPSATPRTARTWSRRSAMPRGPISRRFPGRRKPSSPSSAPPVAWTAPGRSWCSTSAGAAPSS
jgi:hypothetical protein